MQATPEGGGAMRIDLPTSEYGPTYLAPHVISTSVTHVISTYVILDEFNFDFYKCVRVSYPESLNISVVNIDTFGN